MIIFCEECGTRNYIEAALITSQSHEFKCRICDDLIPIPTKMYADSENVHVQIPDHKILIVDDVPNNRLIMEKILEEHCAVILASNGEEALKLAVKEKPDLILLDIVMPGMNGYEVCKKLKQSKKTRRIPVIFVTAKDETVEEEKGLKLGAIDYIIKPFKFSIIKARVAVHLELKRHQDNLKQRAQKLSLSNRQLKHHIVKRQQIEQKGRHYQNQWLRAFDAIGDIVTIQDVERKIVQANRAACLAVNAKAEELIGKYCYEVFHGGKVPCKKCPSIEMFSDSTIHMFEIHHSKIERTFLVSNTPIYDNTGKWVGWAHTAKDTMEKAKIESQLHYIRKMELLGTQTVKILNHFRDNLSGILSHSQSIRKRHGSLDGISDNVAKIGEAVKQSAQMIDGLEKRIKLSRQQANTQREVTDLSQLLRQLQNSIRTASGNIIDIHIDTLGSLPINGDEAVLNQIFFVLFDNARETMAAGGTLYIEAKRAGKNAWVCIRDTSDNMNNETSGPSSDFLTILNYDNNDSGLKPSLIYDLVKEIGGKISCESDPNHGMMTTLYFPLASTGK
ncbi:response regulator [Desulfococcaceae bacterium HSG9]|nr:response regulator [Desulfococcaceae bacterium HSG9]